MVKLIGSIDEDQKAMLDVLEQAIDQVRAGTVKTVGVVVCFKDGPAHAMAGPMASHLFLGGSMMLDEIKEKCRNKGEEVVARAVAQIIRPGRPRQ